MPSVPSAPKLPPGVGPRKRRKPLWAKLWAAVVSLNLLGILVAIWVARLIREVPAAESTEILLRVLYYAMILVVAVSEALLLDELVFGGGFRRSHLMGRTAQFSKRDAPVEEVAASMQRGTYSFPTAVALFSVVTYLVFNLVNHDFDVYYRRVGKHVSALRGTSPEGMQRRFDAISELSIRREPEVMPVLVRALERPDEVAVWAAWALGRHHDVRHPKQLYKPLVTASRRGDPALRREALVALGRVQHLGMADPIVAALQAELEAGAEIDIRLIYALGAIQRMSAVEVLEDILHSGDEAAQSMAAWALAQHRDQVGGRVVVAILEERLPTASPLLRCAIVHSLGISAAESSNLALMRSYDDAAVEERNAICPNIRVLMRPDREDDPIDLLMPQEALGRKVISSMGQMRATSPEIRAEVEPWLEGVGADPSTNETTRESVHSLLSGIRSARDDSDAPSYEEARKQLRGE